MTEQVELLVESVEAELPAGRIREAAFGHPAVGELLGEIHDQVRFLGPDVLGRETKTDSRFVATVFDPQRNLAVELTGRLDRPEGAVARASAFRPNPSAAELTEALAVLRADERFGAL